jgi:hypothetical protein
VNATLLVREKQPSKKNVRTPETLILHLIKGTGHITATCAETHGFREKLILIIFDK